MKTDISLSNLSEIKESISKIETDLLLIVVDSRVWQLYGKKLKENLSDDKTILLYKALEGENAKTIRELENGLEYFLEKGIHRKAHLIAIGGGATSDFGGFLASTLLRGIDWSVVPTTLLSMVDASIGGKTGVNSSFGKNLIGTFHLPKNVWINPDFLETLESTELQSGKGEILKYGFLSKEVDNLLRNKASLREIIAKCAEVKEELVIEDFKEGGSRISLNLGHTFGHALERIYDLPHGVSVFWGMALIFKLFDGEKFLEILRDYEKSIEASFGNPPWLNKTFPVDKIMELITKDKKKVTKNSVQIVKIKEIGSFVTEDLKYEKIESLLKEKSDELRSFNF